MSKSLKSLAICLIVLAVGSGIAMLVGMPDPQTAEDEEDYPQSMEEFPTPPDNCETAMMTREEYESYCSSGSASGYARSAAAGNEQEKEDCTCAQVTTNCISPDALRAKCGQYALACAGNYPLCSIWLTTADCSKLGYQGGSVPREEVGYVECEGYIAADGGGDPKASIGQVAACCRDRHERLHALETECQKKNDIIACIEAPNYGDTFQCVKSATDRFCTSYTAYPKICNDMCGAMMYDAAVADMMSCMCDAQEDGKDTATIISTCQDQCLRNVTPAILPPSCPSSYTVKGKNGKPDTQRPWSSVAARTCKKLYKTPTPKPTSKQTELPPPPTEIPPAPTPTDSYIPSPTGTASPMATAIPTVTATITVQPTATATYVSSPVRTARPTTTGSLTPRVSITPYSPK